jgi:hypothetical protein
VRSGLNPRTLALSVSVGGQATGTTTDDFRSGVIPSQTPIKRRAFAIRSKIVANQLSISSFGLTNLKSRSTMKRLTA